MKSPREKLKLTENSLSSSALTKEKSPLIDPWGRAITHLRISVTDKCNLTCLYCHREGHTSNKNNLSLEMIQKSVEICANYGIKYVKITGGEPLIRSDILKIVKIIAETPGIEEVSMTTNGWNLEKLAFPLREAGLNRINIGCDSLTSSILPKTIEHISSGLRAAKKANFKMIKLNMVVLRNLNHLEIENMIDLARKKQAILQLIELMETEDPEFFRKYWYPLDSIEEQLTQQAERIHVRSLQARKQYFLPGVIVEVVRSHQPHFCQHCNKIRITNDGYFKPCLRRDDNLVFIDSDPEKSLLEAINRRKAYVQFPDVS
ncbi:MAG: GTP 3',8-cyclase MoaA [Candidatus Hodarchaeota archaeon]